VLDNCNIYICQNFNTEKTIRLRIIVSQNVVHENISLNIVVKVRNYNRPNWRWMFKECGGYISKRSDTFCFELKKNAMIPLPVTTYDIEMVIVIQIRRLKPRASKFRGPPANVNYVFDTVIGLSHLCCYNVLYFLNNPSVIFLTQLHSITRLHFEKV
jgi:hypothetical protein